MEAIVEALKTYVSSNGALAKKLWEKLVRELGLTNDAFKNFVDAVRELEDRLASALERFNVEALATRLKHAW